MGGGRCVVGALIMLAYISMLSLMVHHSPSTLSAINSAAHVVPQHHRVTVAGDTCMYYLFMYLGHD